MIVTDLEGSGVLIGWKKSDFFLFFINEFKE